MNGASGGHRTSGSTRAAKRERQRAMHELVSRLPITSQQEFVELLAQRGIDVTQATVSRDIADLGLVKVVRADRHIYASPEDLAPAPTTSDETLRRLLVDLPLTVRRSGLILLLISTPGTANAIAQAIDQSNLVEQEGTLAGDNTLLVLFADEERLLRWLERFERLRGTSPRGPAVVDRVAGVDAARSAAVAPSPTAAPSAATAPRSEDRR